MSLRERLGVVPSTPSGFGGLTDTVEAPAQPARAYQAIKSQIHQALLRRLDLATIEDMAPERLRDELRTLVERLLVEENLVLNAGERRSLVRDIQNEMLGFGPLEPLPPS